MTNPTENQEFAVKSLVLEYINRLQKDPFFYEKEKTKLIRAVQENAGELKSLAWHRLDILDAVYSYNGDKEGRPIQ